VTSSLKLAEVVHNMRDCTPVAVDVSTSVLVVVFETLDSMLQSPEGQLASRRCVAAFRSPNDARAVNLLIFHLPDESPQVGVTYPHLSVPSVVEACALTPFSVELQCTITHVKVYCLPVCENHLKIYLLIYT